MWKRVKGKGKIPSLRNCVAGTATGSVFVMFGGLGLSEKERFNDVYVFNPLEKKWTYVESSGDQPTPRYSVTLNIFQDKLVLFGGFDGNRLNSVHFLDTHTWDWKFMVTNGDVPEQRSHHTAALSGNRLIVFGGLSQEGKRLNDLHVLDLSSLSWYQPQVRGKLPSPRLGHFSAVLGGNVLAVFGGYGDPDEGHMKFNDINLLHFDTMTWTQPIVTGKPPPPTYAHSGVALGDKLLVFGGDNGTSIKSLSSDVYVFELSKMKWTKIDGAGDLPPPRSHFASGVLNGKLYVFGGSGKGEHEKLNDLYALDLSSIEILKEVTFDEIHHEVDNTVDFVMEEMNRILDDISTKSKDGKNSTEYKQGKKIIDEKINAAMQKMKGQFEKLVLEKEKVEDWRKQLTTQIEEEKTRMESEKIIVSAIVASQAGRVILNVGGQRFDTSLATLCKDQNSLLSAMFSGRYKVQADQDGSYFIDRDGAHFRYILNYLRDNVVAVPPNKALHVELLREAEFYQLHGLIEMLKTNLKKLDRDLEKDTRSSPTTNDPKSTPKLRKA